MAKDKKRLVDESEQKETVFYYEITGFILILFSFITLGKLGNIGSLIGKLIKVLFGDFYWLFLEAVSRIGILSLFSPDAKLAALLGFSGELFCAAARLIAEFLAAIESALAFCALSCA